MRIISYIAFFCLIFTNLVNASDICCCAIKNSNSQVVSSQTIYKEKEQKIRKHHCCPSSKKRCKKPPVQTHKDHSKTHQDNLVQNIDDCNCQKDLQTQAGIILGLSQFKTISFNTLVDTYRNINPCSKPNIIYYPPKLIC